MAKEIKTEKAGGKTIETTVSERTKSKFKKFIKRNHTSQSQWLRDQIQGAVKGIR